MANCSSMIDGNFAHAKSGDKAGPVTDPIQTPVVFITLTRHTLSKGKVGETFRDVIVYANGTLILTGKSTSKVLSGKIKAWANTASSYVPFPVPKVPAGQIDLGADVLDLFPDNQNLSFEVILDPGGKIRIRFSKDGVPETDKLIEFQPDCNNGLLTKVVGIHSYSISLRNGFASKPIGVNIDMSKINLLVKPLLNVELGKFLKIMKK